MKSILRSKLRLLAGRNYFMCQRYWEWEWLKKSYGAILRTRNAEPLSYSAFGHPTPLRRHRLKWQYAALTNAQAH